MYFVRDTLSRNCLLRHCQTNATALLSPTTDTSFGASNSSDMLRILKRMEYNSKSKHNLYSALVEVTS